MLTPPNLQREWDETEEQSSAENSMCKEKDIQSMEGNKNKYLFVFTILNTCWRRDGKKRVYESEV